MKIDWKKLIAAIVICQGTGLLAGLATASSVNTWYDTLTKPGFTPPNWLFAPVWTTLYFLMAIAAYLVWRKGINTPGVKRALGIFLLQLLFNGLWSIFFFGLQSPVLGLLDIIILIILLVLTIIYFYRIKKWAAYLLIPYLVWVLYATALNTAIVVLN